MRGAQRSVWDIVRTRIVPVWERLVALDRRDGMARVAADETREFLRLTGCPSQWGRSTVRMLRSNGRAFGQRPGRPPSGARLDLRQAVAFEADRSRYRSLWSRPVLPVRRDPAVLLLVDRSGSMTEGERMRHAFDGLVLLVEVCRRVGVPAAV